MSRRAAALLLAMGVAFPPFDLEAHRGGRDARPENTLAAFRYALELGVNTLELDLQVTRDGRLVVSHNPRLEAFLAKGPDGRWVQEGHEPLIHALTFDQVQRYDVGAVNPAFRGYWEAHGRTQVPSPGERMPAFEAVLDLAKRAPGVHPVLNVETKIDPTHPETAPDPATFTRMVVEAVHRAGFDDQVMLESFDWRTLREAVKQAPGLTRVALTDGVHRMPDATGRSPWMAGLDAPGLGPVAAAAAIPAQVYSPDFHDVTPDLVAEVHRHGMRLVPWTVDDPADMVRLIGLGVDGFITDRPAAARTVLAAIGWPLPAASGRIP